MTGMSFKELRCVAVTDISQEKGGEKQIDLCYPWLSEVGATFHPFSHPQWVQQ
jgi:hypothetical protein